MMKNSVTEWFGCGLSAFLTATQTSELFQTISLILTCLATAVTLAFNIYKWAKKAKADGKITAKELGEGISIIKQSIKDVKNNIVSSDEEDKE